MRHVIVGNGIAGVSAAQVIRGRDEDAQITLISDETPHFYSRTALMWIYMRQLTRRDTEPFERSHWQDSRLELVSGRVGRIDRQRHELELEDGKTLPYDRLLLAVGGQANMFGWPGQDLDGVCNMTTFGDLDKLEAVRPRLKRAVVVGGGLIGIEMVEMMLHDRVPVTYLVREPWYWDLALSEQEARIVEAAIREHGAELILEDEIGEIRGEGQVREVLTKKGKSLPCEMLGIAVGLHSNTDLAKQAELEVGRGIVVDGALRSSDDDIFAAGDCAELHLPGVEQPLLQKLWYTGQRQGLVAGRAMLGDEVTYDPGINYNSAQFMFLDYVTVGWMKRFKPELEEWFHQPAGQPQSIRIAHADGQVAGMSMLGPRWNAAVMMRWIKERRDIKWVVKHLDEALFNEEFRPNRFQGVAHA